MSTDRRRLPAGPGTAGILPASDVPSSSEGVPLRPIEAETNAGGTPAVPATPGWGSAQLAAAFEVLAEAPDGIKRLRELVLQLAVRGKLVPQIEGEAPWAKGGAEGPFEVPAGWVWATVEQLGDLGPRNKVVDSTEVGFVAMPAIPTDLRDPMTCERRSWAEVKKGYTHFAEGDVLVAKITPCFQNLKSCVAEGLPNGIGAGTTELYVVRPQLERVLPRYLLLYFKTPDFVAGGVATYSGTAGQQRVSSRYFAQAPVPIPPLAEQHRIVARVDALMSLLDRLETARNAREATRAALRDAALAALRDADTHEEVETAWQRIAERMPDLFTDPADLGPLRQTVLQLAVRGRLVRQDPSDEPARLPAAEGLFEVPTTWKWSTVNDACSHVVDCLHRTPAYTSEGFPAIRTADVIPGQLLLGQARKVSLETYLEQIRRLEPLPGDIVYSREGERLGIAAVIPEGVRCCLSQRMAHLRPSKQMSAAFLMWYLNSPSGYRAAVGEINQTTSPHVNMASIRALAVPVPPLAEQHRIVAKVNELTTLIHRLEHHFTTAREAQTAFAAAAVHHLDA